MADDINAARRTELNNQLVTLAPEIRGLDDLARTSVSPDLAARITAQSDTLKRRRDLIQAELNGMDSVNVLHASLLADGYPSLPAASVMGSLFDELQEELADLQAAVGIFVNEATNLKVTLGTPTSKS